MVSPHFVDLTLVDLPGLVRNPGENQPKDIADQVKNMVLNYIKRQNSLILAVTAANQGNLN